MHRQSYMLGVSDGSILFIGTATVLIRYGGFTILTDPNFLHRHERIYLGYGLHATRLTEPSVQIAELPRLDLILLSHLHEDHFDRVAAATLPRETPIVTTPHAAEKLMRKGFVDTRPTRTWQTRSLFRGNKRLDITAMPGRHGPPIIGSLLPPVMGSLLDFSAADGTRLLRLYISGDTVVYPQLHEIRRRFSEVDLALLHLGGTRVAGILVTMDGRQGVEALRIINPRTAIPIHYNDYDRFRSPLSDFQREVHQAGLDDRVHYLLHGEEYRFTVGAQPPAPVAGPEIHLV